jgi:hypothetical protein
MADARLLRGVLRTLFVFIKTSSTSSASKLARSSVKSAMCERKMKCCWPGFPRFPARAELQRKLNQGLIALQPIQDHAIARIGQPMTR